MLQKVGKAEGLCNVGIDKNTILKVDQNIFREELNGLLLHYDCINPLIFLN